MNTNNSAPVTVSFRSQGGKQAQGTVVGRKGAQLLLSYATASGEIRERWIASKRVDLASLRGDLETVSRFKTVTCKATRFESPLREYDALLDARRRFLPCSKCGEQHHPAYSDGGLAGFMGRTSVVRVDD